MFIKMLAMFWVAMYVINLTGALPAVPETARSLRHRMNQRFGDANEENSEQSGSRRLGGVLQGLRNGGGRLSGRMSGSVLTRLPIFG